MIFETEHRTRWRAVQVVFALGAFIIVSLLAIFVASVLVTPKLSKLSLDENTPTASWLDISSSSIPADLLSTFVPQRHLTGSLWGHRQFLRTTFVVQEAPHTLGDLRNNLDNLDLIFPDYFHWIGAAKGLAENIDPKFAAAIGKRPIGILPMLSNDDAMGNWHGAEVDHMLGNALISQQLIDTLLHRCLADQVDGINVDFENLSPSSRQDYARWIKNLASTFHAHGMFVCVDVDVSDNALDYEALAQGADAVVVMAYDQHYAAGKPGPIASPDWTAEHLNELEEMIPPQKMIVAIGGYGYDWDLTAGSTPHSLGFNDVMLLADKIGAVIETDTASRNSHFSYIESDGDQHQVWFLDAVSAWNQFLIMQQMHVAGISLWRLGLEDSGFWRFVSSDPPESFDVSQLSHVETSAAVILRGDGEIYRIDDVPSEGLREVTFDENKLADYAGYVRTPRYPFIEQIGHSEQKKIALTFDDGPDPAWTPELLRFLKANDIKATFFLVGDRAQLAPALVKQEFDQGHTIGSHTFTHPHLDEISDRRIDLELDATQRVIEGITGRQTLLFRAPFDTDTTPLSQAQLLPLRRASQRGYWLVGANLDSSDTELPSASLMLRRVLNTVEQHSGNIVVFHDAGTNRRQTLDAVERLIPILKSRGYQFVTVDQLMGVQRDQIMPPAPVTDRWFNFGNNIDAIVRAWLWPSVWSLLLAASALSIIRVIGLGVLIIHSALFCQRKATAFAPPVTVVIPAYNEDKVIARTIRGVLESDYPALHILVVDDGSRDQTSVVVRQMVAADSRIRLLSKMNGGKFTALNLGFTHAEDDYVVTIDADTIVMPQTIRELMLPFADTTVDAVCGNVQVGNVRNLLTAFQDIEYVTTQNYDRRAFESLNCITVVPGATGAWKRSKILAIGGYSGDTLTEDADLTISLLRHDGKIVYAPLARSVTEAPENLRAWFKQRFRWRFGMFQCLWKHRRGFGHALLGRLALPNICLQMLFELLSPLCDFLLLLSLVSGNFRGVAYAYLLFLSLDLAAALIAYSLDRRSPVGLFIVPLQRFFYRPILYLVTFRAALAVLRGRRHGWNKLCRTASVSHTFTPYPEMVEAL